MPVHTDLKRIHILFAHRLVPKYTCVFLHMQMQQHPGTFSHVLMTTCMCVQECVPPASQPCCALRGACPNRQTHCLGPELLGEMAGESRKSCLEYPAAGRQNVPESEGTQGHSCRLLQ